MRTPPQSPSPAPVIVQVPTPPPTPIGLQGLEGLAGQLGALEAQLAGLQAQARNLRAQMRRGGADRIQTSAQLGEVNAQIDGLNAQIAAVRADVAARVGIQVTPPTPPFQNFGRRGPDGDEITAIFIVFMLAVLMPLSIGITRRLWRRGPRTSEPRVDDVIVPRLERLEQAVDAVAIEIERVAESQRFVTRILAERPRPAATNSPAASTPEAAGERPILALGAGPMENVRVPEREAARQVVTPH